MRIPCDLGDPKYGCLFFIPLMNILFNFFQELEAKLEDMLQEKVLPRDDEFEV